MIYIVPIEPIDQRYTKQWYENIPIILKNKGLDSITIDGDGDIGTTTQGAFLDFGITNHYKASQVQKIAKMFNSGQINSGDKFLVTDAWNFAITAIRYMSDLLGISVEIHGIWHAGAYDPSDILGMKMNKPWPWDQERAWFHACDYNYFATEFHRHMFLKNLDIPERYFHKAVRCGQPHELLVEEIMEYPDVSKEHESEGLLIQNMVWPHRLNADKQPEIIRDLQEKNKIQNFGLDIIVTQDHNYSKKEYYDILNKSSIVFSCALHENLGISVMEAVLFGCIPVVPDRCSYKEMYLPTFKYSSYWTETFEKYTSNMKRLSDYMLDRKSDPLKFSDDLEEQQHILIEKYMNADPMYERLGQ